LSCLWHLVCCVQHSCATSRPALPGRNDRRS